MKKGTHKNKELVASMTAILLNVIKYFKDPRMCKSNVNHKISYKTKL